MQTLFVDTAYAEDHASDNLGVDVAPDQLAYLLFTSGSTGEPKGAMCEHAGMLNHLYAKIADLEIGEGQVVPQTGPQCFDISVWQLLAALMVGGRTLLVEQQVILDIEQAGQHLRADRDLGRRRSRGDRSGAGSRPRPTRSPNPQRARLRR